MVIVLVIMSELGFSCTYNTINAPTLSYGWTITLSYGWTKIG